MLSRANTLHINTLKHGNSLGTFICSQTFKMLGIENRGGAIMRLKENVKL